MIHIIPICDIKEHEKSPYCHCKPRVDWDNSIVVHNAFDHREAVEIAKEILEEDTMSREHGLNDIINFGKMEGFTVEEAIQADPEYMVWFNDNVESFPLDAECRRLIEHELNRRGL